MNLNSLDKDKRKHQPYAAEPAGQGDDEPARCRDMLLLIACMIVIVVSLALGALIGGRL